MTKEQIDYVISTLIGSGLGTIILFAILVPLTKWLNKRESRKRGWTE
ncbi:hypothetical protein [Bacillus cereus]|uniref:Phage protein n=1 Tax=Bacillus cereus TIAC219 TaxID=718222 RepID=A0ABC9SQN3_BACCE|nr:hypothetical protein [Bacillus cereus]EJP81079.1 hypothetical protein IC1_06660 [Bacillus cereus VD022]EOQ57890.1 hypothetical protein IAY_06196 [Bacillus cereus TIAC219]